MEGSTLTDRTGAEPTRLFFGPYELRTDSGELFREGVRINLQPQPARLLELLARRSGEVVTRDEIRCHLWGADTFVELEQGLNFSIRKIRVALDDSATSPCYVETIPRRGYRFLAPVRTEPAFAPAEPPPAPQGEARMTRRWSGSRLAISLVFGLALLAAPRDRATHSEQLSAAAFQAYTEGRFLAQRRAPGDRERAIALLDNATALAPSFAPAHAAAARARLDFARPPDEVVAPAEAEALRALALSSCLNEARLVLIDIALYFRFDGRRAQREIDQALACDSRDTEARRVQAAWLAAHGRFEESIEAARQAQLLDPKSEAAVADLAWYSFLARRYGEALDLARRTLALQPEDTWTRQILIEAALRAREPDVALAEANTLLAAVRHRGRFPAPPGHVDNLRPFWDWILQRRSAFATRSPLSPVSLAIPALHLGETDRALQLLEEASRRKFGWELAFLAVDPRFDPLRAEPRFDRILRSLGLPSLPQLSQPVAVSQFRQASPPGRGG